MRSIYLFILSNGKKKKKSLQYLLKARAFMLWTLLSLGRDTVTLESWGRGGGGFLVGFSLPNHDAKGWKGKTKIETKERKQRNQGQTVLERVRAQKSQ